MEIKVLKKVLEANDTIAQETRTLLETNNVRMFNMIGAPGCGKTTLIEKIITAIPEPRRLAVIEGDIETTLDAERLAALSIPVVQINTSHFGGDCHLEAAPVKQALADLDFSGLDTIIVENVGNLVCPVEFDIGEKAKVAVLSVTEGEDKPLKYPLLFLKAQILLLNKVDLVEHLDFSEDLLRKNLKQVNPHLRVLKVSGKTGEGIREFVEWLHTG